MDEEQDQQLQQQEAAQDQQDQTPKPPGHPSIDIITPGEVFDLVFFFLSCCGLSYCCESVVCVVVVVELLWFALCACCWPS